MNRKWCVGIGGALLYQTALYSHIGYLNEQVGYLEDKIHWAEKTKREKIDKLAKLEPSSLERKEGELRVNYAFDYQTIAYISGKSICLYNARRKLHLRKERVRHWKMISPLHWVLHLVFGR